MDRTAGQEKSLPAGERPGTAASGHRPEAKEGKGASREGEKGVHVSLLLLSVGGEPLGQEPQGQGHLGSSAATRLILSGPGRRSMQFHGECKAGSKWSKPADLGSMESNWLCKS